MGKTSLALKIVRASANDGEKGAVAFFSMEMPTTQVTQRLISAESGVPMHKLMSTEGITSDEWSGITSATARMHEQHIAIDDSSALRISDVRARCNMLRRKYGLKLVVIDYLQLMQGKGDNRNQEIGGISRGLKALAKDLGVPVIALSQLSRKIEERADKTPVMSDLRESGEIEQDADLILFTYRDEVYHPNSEYKGTAEIIIGKQRNGPSGDRVRVAWRAQCATFENLAHGWREPEQAATKPFAKRRGFE